MGRAAKITRRSLLIGSAAIAGGVLFGYWKYRQPYDNPLLANLKDGEAGLTPYIKITEQGITIITPRAEMGQGVHTTLAMRCKIGCGLGRSSGGLAPKYILG